MPTTTCPVTRTRCRCSRLAAGRRLAQSFVMKHVIVHDLDPNTARKVADRAFAEYKSKYPGYEPELEWQTENKADVRFRASGMRLNGSVGIEPGAIEFALDVPFFLRPFRRSRWK